MSETEWPEVPDGLEYVREFLTKAERVELLEQVRRLEYTHDLYRGQRLRRGYAQFGRAYVTSGKRLEPAPDFPDFLQRLRERLEQRFLPGDQLQQCIITWYPDGSGIGWHTDAPCFGEPILGLSLGTECDLLFRQAGCKVPTCCIRTEAGSVYRMSGPARWDWQHSIQAVEGERWSLTFRVVRE